MAENEGYVMGCVEGGTEKKREDKTETMIEQKDAFVVDHGPFVDICPFWGGGGGGWSEDLKRPRRSLLAKERWGS